MIRLLRVIVFCMLPVAVASAQNDSMRVFTEQHPLVFEDSHDLWPYSFTNDRGEPEGFCVDLVKAVMGELGIPYVIRLKPDADVAGDLKAGTADLTFGQETGLHDKFRIYSHHAVALFTHSVLTPKSQPVAIKNFRDLKTPGLQVTVRPSSLCHQLMLDYGWGDHALVSKDMCRAVRDVNDRQQGQVLWNTLSLKWMKSHYQLDRVTLTPVNMPHGAYKFVSNNRQLLDRIDRAYASLQADGKLADIEHRWLYPEVERQDDSMVEWVFAALAVLLFAGMLCYLWYVLKVRKRVDDVCDKTADRFLQLCETIGVNADTLHAAANVSHDGKYLQQLEQAAENRVAQLKRTNSECSLRFWSMFYNDQSGIFFFDADGQVQNANPKACELLQCTIDKMVDARVKLNAFFHTAFEDLRQCDGYRGTVDDGTRRVQFQMKTVCDTDGRLTGIFVFCL